MGTKEDEFLERLRATFKVEAAEHLQAIADGLLALEKSPADAARLTLVETVFRAAHSLKGAARAVDFSAIESRCQTLEELFADWKRQQTAPSRGALDQAHRGLDAIANVMTGPAVRAPAAGPASDRPLRHPEIVSAPAATAAVAPEQLVEQRESSAEETVRISVAKLDARLLDAEEMLTVKLGARQLVHDLHEMTQRVDAWRGQWMAVEPQAYALRQAIERPASGRVAASPGLVPVLDFLDDALDHFKALESKVAALARTALRECHVVDKLVDDLLANSKELLRLPFATLTASLPKLVHDLCRDQGKQADLVIRGEEVELDKRILEEMKDPLIHLLRNCVDHGIEPAAERAQRGKPARATITLALTQVNGNKVQLLLTDDGAGIDTRRTKESAIKRGLLSAAEAGLLDEAAAQALIFRSEVSTSPIITQLSGRGLGLAIVREKAHKLGGEVSVESRPGQGTTFRIVVPSMRATFRGVLVEASGRLLVIPTTQVERATRARPDDIKSVEGRETISFDGRAVALVPLADALELPAVERPEAPRGGAPVIILGSGDQRVAFVVDAVLDEQEMLVRPLRKPLARVRNVAGATVLGSGQMAPILNVADLLKSARKTGATVARQVAGAKPVVARSVLVAEDSITSRMLIKGILEAAGYQVKTAVDGMEAFALVRAEPFDLVVSDVEMPRLNGFDLTARIRADKKLAELPVVLVTALETREDRERGIDVGANAYLVKSSFDQSNLLEAVRRLI